VPLVTIKTGFRTADGQEEVLTEYMCDWPDCPNVAVHVLGLIVDIRAMAVVCEKHTPAPQRRPAA
jgi:hypothetical protein